MRLLIVAPAVLIQACLESAQCEPYIDHYIINNESIDAGRGGCFGVKADEALRIMCPLAKKLEARVGKHFPRRVFTRRRCGNHGDRLALDFDLPAQPASIPERRSTLRTC
jgi:hypothetical protein